MHCSDRDGPFSPYIKTGHRLSRLQREDSEVVYDSKHVIASLFHSHVSLYVCRDRGISVENCCMCMKV